MHYYQKNFQTCLFSLFVIAVIASGCQTVGIVTISDSRIPESTLNQLEKIILAKSTRDSVYSRATFIHETKNGVVNVVITRLITFDADSTAKFKYSFSNFFNSQGALPDYDPNKIDRFNEIRTKRPVYYCTPHNGDQHKTEKFEDIPRVRAAHGCSQDWTIEWVDR